MLLTCGVGEDSWGSLGHKEIKAVNPKGNQPWIFIGRTVAEAETPLFWPPDVKSRLIGKNPDAGKDWKQEKKGATEVEMVGWHHWLNGHEFEQAPRDSEGQGSLACCSPQSHKESDTTERLNNNYNISFTNGSRRLLGKGESQSSRQCPKSRAMHTHGLLKITTFWVRKHFKAQTHPIIKRTVLHVAFRAQSQGIPWLCSG